MTGIVHKTTDKELRAHVLEILNDIGIQERELHTRFRVYPQDVTVAPTLTALALANTFGPWAEIIPINTIPFDFCIMGFCVCAVNAATNYHVLLGYNVINADPGTNMELGERRFRIATVPIARQSELMEIRSQKIPAASRVMGRLKTASGNADTCTINIVFHRHIDVNIEVLMWPAFPW